MSDRKAKRENKLREQCEAMASLIAAVRPVYANASPTQRALVETIIGAGLWYLPKAPNAWTGKVSIGALRAFHPDSENGAPRLSEEHVYPRKVAARQLLEDLSLTDETMSSLFQKKYGRVHLITPEENKAVQRHQRVSVFTTPDVAYQLAGISFVELSQEELRKVKRRDRETIERCLRQEDIRAADACSDSEPLT
jgi:hypothetical protein